MLLSSSLFLTISHKNPPLRYQVELQKQRGLTKSTPTYISATYYKNQIQNLECIYSPFPTPLLFLSEHGQRTTLSPWSMTCTQAKRVTGNRRGCAFGPNYSSQTPPLLSLYLHFSWLPSVLKENTSTHSPTQPLSCCPQGYGGLAKAACGAFSGDEYGTGWEAFCSVHVGGFI